MNVSLTPELEKFISAKVESGRYNSAGEVVREALRLLEEHDSARAAQLAEFNEELGRRLSSLDHDEAVEPVEVRARLQRKSVERRKPRPWAATSSALMQPSIWMLSGSTSLRTILMPPTAGSVNYSMRLRPLGEVPV